MAAHAPHGQHWVVLDALLDLAMPRLCVCCRTPDRWALCPRCRPSTAPWVSTPAGYPVAAAGSYDGALRTALLAYKERDRRDLARALGRLLASSVAALDPGPDAVLVPVPSSRRAKRARGGDHVLRLTRVVARETGLASAAPLRLVRTVRDSAGLDTNTRAANLHAAMAAVAPGSRRSAVILDDIATTGATLTEAARALAVVGWQVTGAAVVAVTAKRTGPDRWQDTASRSSVVTT